VTVSGVVLCDSFLACFRILRENRGFCPSRIGRESNSATDLRNAAVNSVQLRPTRTQLAVACGHSTSL
jgi:hypothetical protein